MAKYKVYEDTEGWRTYEVEADSPEEARQKIREKPSNWDSIEELEDKTGYAQVDVVVEKKLEEE